MYKHSVYCWCPSCAECRKPNIPTLARFYVTLKFLYAKRQLSVLWSSLDRNIKTVLFKHSGPFFGVLDRFCLELCTYSLCAEGSCAFLFVAVILPHHICNSWKNITWRWKNNIRRGNDVLLCGMKEVQEVQFIGLTGFSCLDAIAPATEAWNARQSGAFVCCDFGSPCVLFAQTSASHLNFGWSERIFWIFLINCNLVFEINYWGL
jgi:hypothetical protein